MYRVLNLCIVFGKIKIDLFCITDKKFTKLKFHTKNRNVYKRTRYLHFSQLQLKIKRYIFLTVNWEGMKATVYSWYTSVRQGRHDVADCIRSAAVNKEVTFSGRFTLVAGKVMKACKSLSVAGLPQ